MEQEKKILLKVDTGGSEKTVKSLKKDISDLKDAILNLEKGTKEYDDAVEQLQTSQRELNEVQALTKKTATALEGSYDALTHQLSLLKKEWKATNDEAKRNELGKEIAEINAQLKQLDASTGNFQRNVGNYVSHWEGMPEVTKDFGTAMREMNETIEPTKQKFESIGKIASGLASGFAAVQGAAALLGVENEDLEKTFVKLQAAIALAQGIGGLSGLVEGLGKAKVAFNEVNNGVQVVNKTMGKTGWLAVIVLITTAITALVTHLVKKNKAIKDSASALREYNKVAKEAALETANETLELKIYNDIATDVTQTMDIRRKAGIEALSILRMEITETNILAAVNGELAEKVKSTASAMERQAMAQAGLNKLTDLYTEYMSTLSEGPNYWDRVAESFDGKMDLWENLGNLFGIFGKIFGSAGAKQALGVGGEEQWEERLEEQLNQLKEFYKVFKEKFAEVFGNGTKEAWEAEYKQLEQSMKSEEQLLKEEYERRIIMAKEYGGDISLITKKYNEDLQKLRETNKKKQEQLEKEKENAIKEAQAKVKQAADADIAHIERVFNRRIATAKMTAKNEKEAEEKSYELTLEKEQEKLDVIKDALAEAYKDEDKNAKLITDLVQEKADKEVEIEELKYNHLEKLRRIEYKAQRDALRGMEDEFRQLSRRLAIESPSSQDKKERNVFGTLLGFGANDDYLSEQAQREIDNDYYTQAYEAEQQYLADKLALNKAYLEEAKNSEWADEQMKLDLAREIANTELEIEESKYAEKERLRQEDYLKEKEKQEKTQAIFNQSLQATSSLLNGIADAYESSQKRENESDEEKIKSAKKVKNLRIAAAYIDMFQGATTAFASAMQLGPIAGPIVGGINAAAVMATGLANINRIKSTNADGSSVNGGGTAVTPNVQSYSSELPVNYTRNVTGASEIDEINKPTKVYVVESDITDAQTKAQVRSSESTF